MKKTNLKTTALEKFLQIVKIYGTISLGSFVAALGVNIMAPFNVTAGGVSGVAVIVNSLTGFPIGLTMFMINIPLFLIALKFLGVTFVIRSLCGVVTFSLFTDLTSAFPVFTSDIMLATLLGGTLLGLGMGAVFLTGATIGGSDVVANLGHKLLRFINLGQWLFIVDFAVITATGVILGNYDLCLYGLIALFLNSYLIDFMIQGANVAKTVYIISPFCDEIAAAVLKEMSRGVTGIPAKGMYSGKDTTMLMCVVKGFEFQRLERLVKSYDPDAFIILTQARQVMGEGFRRYPVQQ